MVMNGNGGWYYHGPHTNELYIGPGTLHCQNIDTFLKTGQGRTMELPEFRHWESSNQSPSFNRVYAIGLDFRTLVPHCLVFPALFIALTLKAFFSAFIISRSPQCHLNYSAIGLLSLFLYCLILKVLPSLNVHRGILRQHKGGI